MSGHHPGIYSHRRGAWFHCECGHGPVYARSPLGASWLWAQHMARVAMRRRKA